jgi:asparagine synthase (glutamine-hydrolysing)
MAGLIPYITCKEIKKLGFRVAITANGADELFFGYDRMKDFKDQHDAIWRNFSFINDVKDGSHVAEWQYGAQWREIISYLTFDLNKTLDFASMCHSVEVRVPYLDHELVEAALSIHMSQHVGQYGNKTILKKMLAALGFDWGFIHRPKVGFSLHHEPNDLQDLKNRAMKWYKSTDYPDLPQNSTPRQESYHQMTVVGLYLWHKINKKS